MSAIGKTNSVHIKMGTIPQLSEIMPIPYTDPIGLKAPIILNQNIKSMIRRCTAILR